MWIKNQSPQSKIFTILNYWIVDATFVTRDCVKPKKQAPGSQASSFFNLVKKAKGGCDLFNYCGVGWDQQNVFVFTTSLYQLNISILDFFLSNWVNNLIFYSFSHVNFMAILTNLNRSIYAFNCLSDQF